MAITVPDRRVATVEPDWANDGRSYCTTQVALVKKRPQFASGDADALSSDPLNFEGFLRVPLAHGHFVDAQ